MFSKARLEFSSQLSIENWATLNFIHPMKITSRNVSAWIFEQICFCLSKYLCWGDISTPSASPAIPHELLMIKLEQWWSSTTYFHCLKYTESLTICKRCLISRPTGLRFESSFIRIIILHTFVCDQSDDWSNHFTSDNLKPKFGPQLASLICIDKFA